jgi:hypothetical protein
MFPRVCGIADCIMQGCGGKNVKLKPLECTRIKGKGNFEKKKIVTEMAERGLPPPGSRQLSGSL